jgi:DNA-binding Lrp family transcriptional regulator
MSKIDYNLLYLRSENARMPLRTLAKYLRRSPQSVKYAISVLEREGILRVPYCVFDYSYFGLLLFRIYFKGGYISVDDKTRIISELNNNPYVVSIYELTGEYDLAVEFLSPNPSKFNKEFKKTLSTIPTLNDYKVTLNLVTHICPRRYLVQNPAIQSVNAERVVGGDREERDFSDTEKLLIHALLDHPAANLSTLAEESGLNPKTIRTVMQTLMKRHLIQGVKWLINTEKVGVHKFRLFLKLHNLSYETETGIVDVIRRTPEVVQINKTVGDWDLEVDIESFHRTRTRAIIMDIRQRFRDLIERFNLIEFDEHHKRAYLPAYLFSEEKTGKGLKTMARTL